jgi:hypothetical protein
MSKTKEEILNSKAGRLYEQDVCFQEKSGVEDAMDEYAEQQSIEFVKWIIKEQSLDHLPILNIFQLYQLFLNDQNKTTTCQICSRILPEEVRHCEINDCPHK